MDNNKDKINLLDIISVIIKKRKLIVSSFLIGSLIALVGIGYIFINKPKIDFQEPVKQENTYECKTELILQSALINNLDIDLSIRAESYLMSGEIKKLLSNGNIVNIKYEPTKKVISYTLIGTSAESLQENSKLILNALTVELREYLSNAIQLVIAKQESELELKPDVILKNPTAYIDAIKKMAETEVLYISIREHEIALTGKDKESNYAKFIILPFGFLFFAVVLAFIIEYFSKIKADTVLYEHFLQESGLKKIRKE